MRLKRIIWKICKPFHFKKKEDYTEALNDELYKW